MKVRDRRIAGGRRSASRRLALVGALLSIAAAAWAGAWAWPSVSTGVRSLGWPSTEGVLLDASRWREYRPGFDTDEYASWLYLDYAFSVDGGGEGPTHHRGGYFDVTTSADTRKHYRSFVSLGMAREAMRRAPSVRVWYDPVDPSRSVVRPGIAYGTTASLMLVIGFLGCAAGLLRVSSDRGDRTFPPILGLVSWIVLFPIGWFALAGCLGVVWDRTIGGVPPVSIVLAYLGLSLLVVTWPRLVMTKPVGAALVSLGVAIPLLAALAFVFHLFDGDGRLVYEPTDATLLARLDSPNPHVRAATARRIASRAGPIEAGPRLVRMLASEPDATVRGEVAHAIQRLRIDPRALD